MIFCGVDPYFLCQTGGGGLKFLRSERRAPNFHDFFHQDPQQVFVERSLSYKMSKNQRLAVAQNFSNFRERTSAGGGGGGGDKPWSKTKDKCPWGDWQNFSLDGGTPNPLGKPWVQVHKFIYRCSRSQKLRGLQSLHSVHTGRKCLLVFLPLHINHIRGSKQRNRSCSFYHVKKINIFIYFVFQMHPSLKLEYFQF